MNIQAKVRNTLDQVRLFWSKPPHGRYMSFKEIASFSFGGTGVRFLMFCVQNMILAVGNTLIGNTIGIEPRSLYAIYLISVLSGFPLTALRAKLIDSSRNKKGKYRPFILSMGLPTTILALGFVWMPYERMNMLGKSITVLLFNIAFQFFYNFYYDSYESLINLLSPNTLERSDVLSIRSVVDSLGYTIAGVSLPILARLVTGENTLFDLKIYRVIYPPFIIVGFLLSLLVYFNTEEKIIQAKTHIVQMKFSDAFRAVAKNKYFWIMSLAGWLGFLESSIANILGWIYNYQEACSAAQYSLITAINGNASLWPMLLAPFLIRVLGKRNMLVFSNLLNIFFILIMFPLLRYGNPKDIIWWLLLCTFINTMATWFGHILHPSINADIRDYQQYISGERIDGMFVAVGLIGSLVMLATSFILPEIYRYAGLNETVAVSLGYSKDNVYDVLYNLDYFQKIGGVLVLASTVGAILNVIPFFFYDLTEVRQRAMIAVLKIRAAFEDYGNNALADEALIETIDIIEKAHVDIKNQPIDISKAAYKAILNNEGKEAYKAAKKAKKDHRQHNEDIEVAKLVIEEITKFETQYMQDEILRAEKILSFGITNLAEVTTITLEEARAMPKSTKEERRIRSEAITNAKAEIESKKLIAKHYPEGLTEFDASVFDKLFDAEDKNQEDLKEAYIALEKAKEAKNKGKVREIRNQITELKITEKQIKIEIKKATKQNSIYNRAARPYLNAKKLVTQKENYSHYEDIRVKYEESKERTEQERIEREAKEKREKEERDAYIAKIKAEKKAKKNNKSK